MRLGLTALTLFGLAVGASSDASAQRRHRHVPPYPAWHELPAYDGSAYSAAELNRVLTEQAQHEPGLATELFPDFRQTATGGPSGGFPGGGL